MSSLKYLRDTTNTRTKQVHLTSGADGRALCGFVAARPQIESINDDMIAKYGVSAHPRCICKKCLNAGA